MAIMIEPMIGRASWNRTSIADLEGLGPIR